ncbi:MAG: PilZ domain-containing protein [Planctomycetes bacterium]|nr:PilZ domain-containing protein [Planctomycetota bacterium]
MSTVGGNEKRRAARIKFRPAENLGVRYKFLSHVEQYQCDKIFPGLVHNLSKGGMLFTGPIPGPEWLPRLGEGRILIGLNLVVPDGSRPIKALASLRWCRPSPEHRPGQLHPPYDLGVQFEQLEPEHRSNLSKFLIGVQIRTRKFNRRELLEDGFGPGSMPS